MTRHYPDLASASDWLNQISRATRPIRSTTQIWVVTRHQYGISALVSQTSFGGETNGSVANVGCFLRLSLLLCFSLLPNSSKRKKGFACRVVKDLDSIQFLAF